MTYNSRLTTYNLRLTFLSLACILSLNTHAQDHADTVNNFIPLEKVIFEDDFTNEAINAFPSLWYSRGCDSLHALANAAFVHQVGGKRALSIKATQSSKDPVLIAPGITGLDYLPDDFTLEYDFLMGDKSYNSTLLFDYGAPCKFMMFRVYRAGKDWIITDNLADPTAPIATHSAALPHFDPAKWHHMAMSYSKKQICCFLDNKKVLTATNEKYNPHAFMLQTNGSDYVSYTNVRLATHDNSTVKITNFNALLTKKKFTTHDINFDEGKSIVKPESMDLLKQLAKWLNAKRFIKIEIDGHTDNVGNAAFNMQLSQARADEVKKQLVALGVNTDRLTTKGFGDTKPIKSNGTDKGKADNRRVEFIKVN